MCIDLFHVDWVFWGTIIIILLISFLVSVKIFKYTQRWRSSLSNTSLILEELRDFKIETSQQHRYKFSIVLITTREVLKAQMKAPLIIIFKHKEQTLSYAEALANIGNKVIIIDFAKLRKIKNGKFLKTEVDDELLSPISKSVCNYFSNLEYGSKEECNLVLFPNAIKHFLKCKTYEHIFNNIFLIFGNIPKDFELLDKFLQRNSITKSKFYYIIPIKRFLKDSKDLLNPLNRIKKTYKLNEKNFLILENSTKSMKNYETIVIGFISNIILNNIN